MSIINEALKKAQEANRQQQANAAGRVSEPSEDILLKTKISQLPAAPRRNLKLPARVKWFAPALIAVVIIVTGQIFLKKIFRTTSPVANLLLTPAHIPETTPSSSPSAAPAPISQNAQDLPALMLTGIVYDNEKPYAIVNNKVLSKGDMIDGAMLIEINRESVKFVFNDEEFELSSK